MRVGQRLGIPVVYEVRAFWEDAAVDHGTSREWDLRYRLTRNLETYALRRAAHVTTICEGLKREIVQRGVPDSRVTVIPNAVDIGSFRFDEPADVLLKQKLGLEGRTVIGFIGSFYAYEGLDLLLDALPRVLAELEDVRLAAGRRRAPRASCCARRWRDSGLTDKVVFTGRVPARRCASLLQHRRHLRLSAPFHAPHGARDPAEAARSDGAGPAPRRLRRRRSPQS